VSSAARILLVMEHNFVEVVVVDLLSLLSNAHGLADLIPQLLGSLSLFFAQVVIADLVASDDAFELIYRHCSITILVI